MRSSILLIALLVAGLAPSAAAQVPQPTTSELSTSAFNEGVGNVSRGGTLDVHFDVTFTVEGVVCASAGGFDVELTADVPQGIGVTFHPSTLVFHIEPGPYPPSSPYTRSITANATIRAASDAPASTALPYTFTATFDGTSPDGCSTVPSATAEISEDVRVQGSLINGTPIAGTGALVAVAVGAALLVRPRGRQ